MIINKHEPLTFFEIWQPRWHDKVVLLNAKKIKDAKTRYLKIVFTKASSMEGNWVISKTKALGYPLETNGSIQCRAIPLSELEILEINERDLAEVL